eukprot:4650137-Amphidinium_carterae.1
MGCTRLGMAFCEQPRSMGLEWAVGKGMVTSRDSGEHPVRPHAQEYQLKAAKASDHEVHMIFGAKIW